MTSPDTASLIETMRVEPGHRFPLRELHLSRLKQSSETLGFAFPDNLDKVLNQRISRLDRTQTHKLRLLLDKDGTVTLEASPLPPTPPAYSLLLQHAPRPEVDRTWVRHKTTHRPWYAAAAQWLERNPDVFDLIYCDINDKVCEGSRTNIYIRDAAGRWLTPPLEVGILPGVQRQLLLEQGLVHEAPITRSDLLKAREIRISNALRGWLPASLVRDFAHIGV